MQTALNSRVIIEQAKGVLVQHRGPSMGAAFDGLF
ncbi:MAG: ANTAR domain-containing protein [Pseudonocardiaceae bacterium]